LIVTFSIIHVSKYISVDCHLFHYSCRYNAKFDKISCFSIFD